MVQIRPVIEEGIDRKDLSRIRSRFLQLNQVRLERAGQSLSARQQQVLRLLPLLLHVSHPLLPGYVSAATPAGFGGYEPDPGLIQEAQGLARSFSYRVRTGYDRFSLYSLFLMGSVGSIGHGVQSDMDFWLCHAPELDAAALASLRRKCDALQKWAGSLGAQIHIFLINPEHYVSGARDGVLTSDDCGTTQHYLLLDEFYRTSVWLAGRTPLWWYVPDYEEHRYGEYCATLLEKRFVRREEVVDLGHLAQIPAREFAGAGMWQIYKGIAEPYKSLLKLLLIEVYAGQYPQVDCVSRQFKRALYDNEQDADSLDAYVMLYRQLERYLQQRNERERLELVRRCFYLKIGIRMGQPGARRRGDWQRNLLWQLVSEWGWTDKQLKNLDRRNQWRVGEVRSERRLLVRELMASYRFLGDWAQRSGSLAGTSARDLAVLGRRLYAAFERKADKIEHINPQISDDMSEPFLTLAEYRVADDEYTHWAFYPGNLRRSELEFHSPLKRMPGLLELLAWAYRNGIVDAASSLTVLTEDGSFSERDLHDVLQRMAQEFPLGGDEVAEQVLLQPARTVHGMLVVNLARDPFPMLVQEDIQIATGQTNPLDFSGRRVNLVRSIDRLSLNSWNELLVQSWEGADALADCLSCLLAETVHPLEPGLRVYSFGRTRAPAIAARVEEVAQQLLQAARQGNVRYLLQLRAGFHVLEWNEGAVDACALPDIQALEAFIADPRHICLPWLLDQQALEGHPLRYLLMQAVPGRIELYFQVQGDSAELYLFDEGNRLFRQRSPFVGESGLLLPWQRFFAALQFRRNARLSSDGDLRPGLDVRYFRIVPAGGARARGIEACQVQVHVAEQFYAVQAIVGSSGALTLYCNGREFSRLDHGEQLYRQVATEILSARRNGERYPCYITDLDLPQEQAAGRLHTVELLQKKYQLESLLNQALQQLAE